MKIFQIKHSSQLTWEDIPYVEAPVFAHHHIMNMLIDPNQLWMRIQNIQEFIRKEVGRYKPLQNHDLVNDRINYLISSAQYFNVSLSGKPFRAAFEWQSDENHLHKGFWEDKYNFYWMSPRVIQHHLDRIAREWHRKQNSAEENFLSSREGVAAYAADPFTAQGMNSGYALSSPEQLKYISPVSGKSAIKQVDYLEIVDDTLMGLGFGSTPILSTVNIPDDSGLQPFLLKSGDTGQFVKDAQRIMLSRGWDQPVLGLVGPQTLGNMESFNLSLANGTLPPVQYGDNPSSDEIDNYLKILAKQEGVPLKAAKALLAIESSGGIQFDSNRLPLVNPAFNSSAVGIMQIVDSGARQAVKNPITGKPLYTYREIAYDWRKNMEVGMKYFGGLYARAPGDSVKMRAVNAYQQYHDGPNAKIETQKIKASYLEKYNEIK